MDLRVTRRGMLQSAAVASAVLGFVKPATAAFPKLLRVKSEGGITGHLTGAQAVVAALKQQGVGCVFGIPGAQENELWDEFKSGGISGEFPDSYRAEAPIVTLTPEWQEYVIDLDGQDMTTVIGGFIFAVAKDKNPDGATFYLDEIRFQSE